MIELQLYRVVSIKSELVKLPNCKTLDLTITLDDGTETKVILFHDKDLNLKIQKVAA